LMFVCLVGGVFLIVRKGDWAMGLGGILVFLAIFAMAFPTRYEITSDRLRVRAGLFLWKIPLRSIRSARYSSNPLSSPAWSLRRIHVAYERPGGRRSFVLISPRDREVFMRELAEATPGLEIQGERLVREIRLESTEGKEP